MIAARMHWTERDCTEAKAAGCTGGNPEDRDQWATVGGFIARRNLVWSIFAEFLGFAVWAS